jgi:hypothetical protein
MGRCDDVTTADFIRQFLLATPKPLLPEKATCGHWSDGGEGRLVRIADLDGHRSDVRSPPLVGEYA